MCRRIFVGWLLCLIFTIPCNGCSNQLNEDKTQIITSNIIHTDTTIISTPRPKVNEAFTPTSKIKTNALPTKIVINQNSTEIKSTCIDASENYTIALKENGTVWCWGEGIRNELGIENKKVPGMIKGLDKIIAVSAGFSNAVALKSDGTVWEWSIYHPDPSYQEKNLVKSPRKVEGVENIVAISAGYEHVLALGKNGDIYEWSTRYHDDVSGKWIRKVEVRSVKNIDNAVSIAAGTHISFAIKKDGSVWNWYTKDEIPGFDVDLKIPKEVKELNGVKNISLADCGGERFIAIKSDDDIVVGEREWEEEKWQIKNIEYLKDVISVKFGADYFVALKRDGTVWTWGYNDFGQLGNGSRNESENPSMVNGIDNCISISAGYLHVAVISSDGNIKTWGDNSLYQLGHKNNESYIEACFRPSNVLNFNMFK
jgi:alpha-tubulin suppressor-like RCC1 family protein